MERLQQYKPIRPNDPTMHILKAFLDHLPVAGRENLMRHIRSCETDHDISAHAETLVNGLLMPMRTIRSTPTISPRAGVEDSIENIASQSTGPATRSTHLKLDCLARDGEKCVVTGRYERNSADRTIAGIRTAHTECAHIIPFSLAIWRDERDEYAKHRIWNNLKNCFPSIQDEINFTRDSINEPLNAITLSQYLHTSFGRFEFAFEETSRRHTYHLKNYALDLLDDLPRQCTLVQYDTRFALPHPGLLKVHAILARIYHASGAGEKTEKTLDDLRETKVLSKDGSSDLAGMLAMTSLGVLGSRPTNV